MRSAVPPLDISLSTGSAFIGIFISVAFCGMAWMQGLFYFVTYESDKWNMKLMVIILLILNTVHDTLYIFDYWRDLILKYSDIAIVGDNSPENNLAEIITGIVGAICQGFFILRMWRFSRNWLFPAILVPPTVWQLLGRILLITRVYGKPSSVFLSQHNAKLTMNITLTATVVDMLIAVIMSSLLWKGRTGVQGSDRVLLRLMRASVSTGAMTAIFALFTGITIALCPRNFIYSLGAIPLCPLYSNAILANLNCRKYIARSETNCRAISPDNRRTGTPKPSSSLRFVRMSAGCGTGESDAVVNEVSVI